MAQRDVTIRHRSAVIDYATNGAINSVTLTAEVLVDGVAIPGSHIHTAYSADEALAAGVTGAQASAFQDAIDTLRGDWETALVGA